MWNLQPEFLKPGEGLSACSEEKEIIPFHLKEKTSKEKNFFSSQVLKDSKYSKKELCR